MSELSDALFQLSLPQAGNKAEKINRIALHAKSMSIALPDLFQSFTADALRIVCDALDLPRGRKEQMAIELARLCEGTELTGASDGSDNVPVSAPRVLTAAELLAEPEYLTPTLDVVLKELANVVLPKRRVQTEADANFLLCGLLAPKFEAVAEQYSVGGFLGLRIDLDIGNGSVGIEIKLADSLLSGTAEMQRLLGQVVFYSHRRYKDSLVVAIVGDRESLLDPSLKELIAFIDSLGARCVRIPVN